VTTISTHPVRSDVTATAGPADHAVSRTWALAGLGSALLGAATVVTSGMVDLVYREEFRGDATGMAEALEDKVPVVLAFHTVTALGAVLMVVFGAGLFRRLQSTMPATSLAPLVAFAGLAGTAVVSVLGSGLDTEFMFAGEAGTDDGSAAFYNHWVGTIPWLWTLVGLAGVALFVAARAGAVARWQGYAGLVLGGLTLLLGVSPLEYMAGLTGVLWLLVASAGFVVGDRAYRNAS
jgi:hypothetical protein